MNTRASGTQGNYVLPYIILLICLFINIFAIFHTDINDKENLKQTTTPKSRRLQCSYFNCVNRAHKRWSRTPCHFFKVTLQNPLRTTWTNRIGKREKMFFFVTNNTKVCENHFSSEDFSSRLHRYP